MTDGPRLPELRRTFPVRGEVSELRRDRRCVQCGSFIFQGQRAVAMNDGGYDVTVEWAHHEPPCRETITYGRAWADYGYPWHYLSGSSEDADNIVYYIAVCGDRVRSMQAGGQVMDFRETPAPMCERCRAAGPPRRSMP